MVEDGALRRADLLDEDVLAVAQVALVGWLHTYEGGRPRGAADAAQLELTRALHDHHAVLLDEVKRELAHGLSADDHLGACVGDRLDHSLERLLLRVGVGL